MKHVKFYSLIFLALFNFIFPMGIFSQSSLKQAEKYGFTVPTGINRKQPETEISIPEPSQIYSEEKLQLNKTDPEEKLIQNEISEVLERQQKLIEEFPFLYIEHEENKKEKDPLQGHLISFNRAETVIVSNNKENSQLIEDFHYYSNYYLDTSYQLSPRGNFTFQAEGTSSDNLLYSEKFNRLNDFLLGFHHPRLNLEYGLIRPFYSEFSLNRNIEGFHTDFEMGRIHFDLINGNLLRPMEDAQYQREVMGTRINLKLGKDFNIAGNYVRTIDNKDSLVGFENVSALYNSVSGIETEYFTRNKLFRFYSEYARSKTIFNTMDNSESIDDYALRLDADFETTKGRWLNHFWMLKPLFYSETGYHQNDLKEYSSRFYYKIHETFRVKAKFRTNVDNLSNQLARTTRLTNPEIGFTITPFIRNLKFEYLYRLKKRQSEDHIVDFQVKNTLFKLRYHTRYGKAELYYDVYNDNNYNFMAENFSNYTYGSRLSYDFTRNFIAELELLQRKKVFPETIPDLQETTRAGDISLRYYMNPREMFSMSLEHFSRDALTDAENLKRNKYCLKYSNMLTRNINFEFRTEWTNYDYFDPARDYKELSARAEGIVRFF